jgi:hypothetical protein
LQAASLSDFEKRMLKLFADLIRLPLPEHRQLLIEADSGVEKLLQSGGQALGMMETWIWLKSKLSGQPMVQHL